MRHAFISLKRTKNSFRKLALKTVEACLLVLIFSTFFVPKAEAVINQKINYQGKLTNASGVAVSDADYDMVFSLYTAASGGTAIWTESLNTASTDVAVTDGLFSVLLGNVTSLADVNFSQTLYLGVNVEGDGEMTPRKEIGSVPSAFVAYSLDAVNATSTNATTTNLAITGLATPAGTFLAVNQNGQVIATTSPSTSNWTDQGSYLTPLTNADGIILTGSSTITNLTMLNSTTTNATSTNLHVANNFTVELSTTNPAFVVSNTGSSTPAFYIGGVNQNGHIGIGTSTPTEALTLFGGNFQQAPNNPRLVGSATLSTGSFSKAVAVSGRYAYVSDEDAGAFVIFSLATSSPSQLSSLSIINQKDLVVSGRYAYVVTSDDLKIIDISNPFAPVVIDSLTIASSASAADITVSGRYAYIVNSGTDNLQIVDISDPTTSIVVGTLSLGATPSGIAVSGRYAYIIDSSSDDLKVIDISSPTNPLSVSTLSIGSAPADIAISGRYVYVVDSGSDDLKVIDVGNPALPVTVGTTSINTLLVTNIAISGRYAYVGADSSGLKVFDISNPVSPVVVGSLSLSASQREIFVSGHHAYLTTSGFLRQIDISGIEVTSGIVHSLEAGSLQVRESAFIQNSLSLGSSLNVGAGGIFSSGPISISIASTTASNQTSAYFQGFVGFASTSPWGRLSVELDTTNPALVVANQGSSSPAFYIGGVNQNGHIGIGTSTPSEVLHIANGNFLHTPGNLSTLGSTPTGSSPFDIEVRGRYAFVTDDGDDTLKVYDVSTSSPALVSSTAIGGTVNIPWLEVAGNYAYTLDHDGGSTGDFKIFDISKPKNPVNVGSVSFTRATFNGGLAISGGYAYINSGENNGSNDLVIINVANPTSPKVVSTTLTDITRGGDILVSGRYAYLTSASTAELDIYDISNPITPLLVNNFTLATTGAKSMAISGRYLYITVFATLYIYDISDPALIVSEVSSLSVTNSPGGISLSGRYLYVTDATANLVRVIDVADPDAPVQVTTLSLGEGIGEIAVAGRYGYVLDSTTTDLLYKIDLTGLEVTSAIVHSLEAGGLQVRESATIAQNLNVGSALNVGLGGIFSAGPIAVGIASSTQSDAVSALFKGYVGIATTSPWRTFSVNGTVALSGLTSSTAGNAICILASGDVVNAGGATCATSAERFKENITTLAPGFALEEIGKLNVVSFDYKEGAYAPEDPKSSYGLIAEEVEKIDRNLVDYGYDGLPITLKFEKLTGLTIQAIQELNEKVGVLLQGNGTANIGTDKLVVRVKKLVAEEICLGETCITEAELKKILKKAGVDPSPPPQHNDNDDNEENEETATSTPETDQEPAPEISPEEEEEEAEATTTPEVIPVDEEVIPVEETPTSDEEEIVTEEIIEEEVVPETEITEEVVETVETEEEIAPEVIDDNLSTEVGESVPEKVDTP